ncbi:MAG: heat-shock protein [Mariprofundaceae bacterium]
MTSSLIIALLAISTSVLAWLLWRQHRPKVPSIENHALRDERIVPLLRGINYLLNDNPDRALQELMEVAKLRSETCEVYLALAGLFRKKGDMGRAIRIHKGLLARPDLPKSLQIETEFELGNDFHAGGFLDRALTKYAKVLSMQHDHIPALQASLRIREQSHEWQLAQDVLQRIKQVDGGFSPLHHAYITAQTASEAEKQGDTTNAIKLAHEALHINQSCGCAHLLLADIYLQRQDNDNLIKVLHELRMTSPQYLHLIIPALVQHQDYSYFHNFLLESWQMDRHESLAVCWLESTFEHLGNTAMQQLQHELDFKPRSLRAGLKLAAIDKSMDLQLSEQAERWKTNIKNYICEQCGIQVIEMRWQCHQCHEWGTMHPISDEVLSL